MSTICDDLRAAILSAAMQGKLTRQLPEDGDAEELLAEIESKRKTTNKKIKPISSKEELFEIPNNWKWERFGKIVDFNMGKTPPRAEASYWGNDIPWVSIADMPENDILLGTKEKISNKAFKDKFNSKICPKGTLIMSFKLTVGRCSILGIDAVHNEAIISVNPIVDSGFTFRDYLARVLPFLSNYGETKDAIKGRTLNSNSLNNLLIPVPPLAEQKRIVEKVDELMARVADIEQSADALASLKSHYPDEMRASLLQAAMQGKLTRQLPEDGNAEDLLKQIYTEKNKLIAEGKIKRQKALAPIIDDEIPFSIPENWKWVRLGNLTEPCKYPYADGPFGSNLKKEHYTTKREVRIIQLSNIGDGGWKDNNKKYTTYDHLKTIERSEASSGDIVIAKMMPAGRAMIVPDIEDKYVLSSDAVKIVPNSHIDTRYLEMFINSPVFQRQVYSNVQGITRVRTSLGKLINYLVALPPLNEQKRIVNRLDSLLTICKAVDELLIEHQ